MHADKISAKKKKKQPFLIKLVLTLTSSQKGHLITNYQKIYPRSEIKINSKNHGKSHFNLSTGQFLFSKYKIIKELHVLNDVCWPLTKEVNFKYFFLKNNNKKMTSLWFHFNNLTLNRHDLWNMRVDSRTRKIVKQEEYWSSLPNPWQKRHQYFSKKLSSRGQYIGPWKGKTSSIQIS